MSRAVDVGGGSRFRLHRPAQPAPASAYYTYICSLQCYMLHLRRAHLRRRDDLRVHTPHRSRSLCLWWSIKVQCARSRPSSVDFASESIILLDRVQRVKVEAYLLRLDAAFRSANFSKTTSIYTHLQQRKTKRSSIIWPQFFPRAVFLSTIIYNIICIKVLRRLAHENIRVSI